MAGGSVSFESFDPGYGDNINTFTFAPEVGYFFMDNIAADLIMEWSTSKDNSDFGLAIGGRYFHNQFYGGLAFLMSSSSEKYGSSTYKTSANYLMLRGGYLYPLFEHVYGDFGLNWKFGIGDMGQIVTEQIKSLCFSLKPVCK